MPCKKDISCEDIGAHIKLDAMERFHINYFSLQLEMFEMSRIKSSQSQNGYLIIALLKNYYRYTLSCMYSKMILLIPYYDKNAIY